MRAVRCFLFLLGLPGLLLLATPVPSAAQSPEEQLAAASALFEARKFADAADRLERFLTANGKHARAGAAALALGRCRSELKQWEKAVPAYERALAAREPSLSAAAQLGLGEAAYQSGQWEKAAAALTAATKGTLKPEQAPVVWLWLAQSQFELKRFPAAEEAYLKVTRDFANSDVADAAWYGAGLAALRQDRPADARQRLRTVVDRYPKSEDRPRAMLLAAQIDLEGKKLPEARAGFEAFLKDPAAREDAEARSAAEDGLIAALLELQDYPAAATRLEAALARLAAADPQRFRAQLNLGHCRYRQKQYAPALAAYLEAAKSGETPVAADGHYWAGNAALALNRPTEAAAEFGKLASRFPEHKQAPKAQLRAGDAFAAAKQADQATRAYQAVLDRFPQSPEAAEARKALGELVEVVDDPAKLAAALKTAPPAAKARGTVRLARLYLNGRKFAEAAPPLEELLRARPEPDPAVAAEAHYLLGLAHEGQDRSAPAAAALAEAVKRAPTASWAGDAQGRLAWLYLELKQPAAAEKAGAAALALKPGADAERQARLAMVQAQLDQEKWDAALEGCRVLLAANPPADTVATVLFTQAWVSEKRGRPQEALPLWEKLAAEHPKSDYAADALLHLGDDRFQAQKFEEARDRYQALLAGFPKSPLAAEARFKLGSALYNLDKAPDAAREFDAVSADRGAGDYVPEALYWAGVALEKAGKKDDAIQRLTRLVTAYPKHARVANAKIRLAALKAVK